MAEAELRRIRTFLPPGDVHACQRELVQVTIRRTEFRCLRLDLQFPEDYPESPLLVEITSRTLPRPSVKRMTKAAERLAAAQAGAPHAFKVFELIKGIVDANKLLVAWGDIKTFREELGDPALLASNDVEGTVKARLSDGPYRLTITLTVPDNYPLEPPTIAVGKTNFHQRFITVYVAQAEELARRCVAGYDPAVALQASISNGMQKPKKKAGGAHEPRVRLTAGTLNNLRNDVQYLHQATVLREKNEAKSRGLMVHSTQERKQARRDLRNLNKAEAANEEEQTAELLRIEELEALAEAPPRETEPQHSVLAVLRFFRDNFVMRLAHEPCQGCEQPIIPADPAAAQAILDSEQSADRPERVYCGHWWHFGCLTTALTTPPWNKVCAVDGRPIFHPDFESDQKKLERAWANQEAKKREIAEVAEFLLG